MSSSLSAAFANLDSLVGTHGVTGYALITSDGYVCSPVKGPLAEELGAVAVGQPQLVACGSSPAPSPLATQFLRPFKTLSPTVSLTALGTKLQVFHQSESSIFALGPRRRLGLGACLVPQGVAVFTFDRTAHPPTCVNAIESCAARVRAAALVQA